MKIIEVKELKKSFDHKKVLDTVSMTVYRGDVYGFLGPNGSGKTTTIRILLGLLHPDAGKVIVIGKDPWIQGVQLRQKINALPESHGFYGWMQTYDYLRFFGELYGLRLTTADCRNYLEAVGLDPSDKRPIRTFSRGMKQRLGIARALVNDAEIVFLDEPTNGLDPKGRREIHDLLLKLNHEKQTTIVLSTHILDDVERLCNRIAILHNLKVRYEGPVKGSVSRKSIQYRFRLEREGAIPFHWNFDGISLLEKKGNSITCLVRNIPPSSAIQTLLEAGIPVVEAKQITGGLEAVYLSYTGGYYKQ